MAEQVDLMRTCSTVQSLQRTFENASTAPVAIESNEVPSLGALRVLKWVETSDRNWIGAVDKNGGGHYHPIPEAGTNEH